MIVEPPEDRAETRNRAAPSPHFSHSRILNAGGASPGRVAAAAGRHGPTSARTVRIWRSIDFEGRFRTRCWQTFPTVPS